ncbi:glycosyltransferase [Leptolyngbya sp. FACHB-261]|uniref:glycosyltransferase n=1 Tax=Leptolyngbya sp. FACHB-261 TaxID=2692806 RepID=UPI0016854A18|nr:glycosyltransferase [Leptolyngbya sp. FACHB-261]MBD2105098.1 glycosyltransferase [Leptolyngbya sp. FACHB-261]
MVWDVKYALVHEWLTPEATGGSELVVQAILRCYNADVFSLIDFESQQPESFFYKRKVTPTFLQHLPGARRGVQKYLPLLPLAIEQLDLREYDVILSSSHAVAKGVLTRADQLHICYCHSPMRYIWDLTFDYLRQSKLSRGIRGALTRYLLHRLRQWDVISANRVDYFIANSQNTARRIWRSYRREAVVIYPPVDLDRFKLQEQKGEYYVTVSRLVGYKQISLIVRAFNQLGRPLVIIGEGPELAQIRKLARANVQVLGFQSDAVVADYLRGAKAFIYAAQEDFGIALVEAQGCGTPVIAYGKGGARETVRDFRQHLGSGTGLLFDRQCETDLIAAVEEFEQHAEQLNPTFIYQHAQKFARERFIQRYQSFVAAKTQEFFLP